MSYSRHKCREYALQYLYQLEILKETSIEEEIEKFFETLEVTEETKGFTKALIEGTMTHMDEIDVILHENLENWRLDRLSLVVRNILRLSLYELSFAKEAPHEVVIDEAVTLAKDFVDDTARSFVNKVLQNIHDRANK